MNLNDVANFIIDKPGETFQVNRRLFTDPQIFLLEMKYIYEKVWVYMAHESEIPNAYDYMTAWLGRKPIMISRDQHGELRGFINACTHRGATLCRTKVGNAKILCVVIMAGYLMPMAICLPSRETIVAVIILPISPEVMIYKAFGCRAIKGLFLLP